MGFKRNPVVKSTFPGMERKLPRLSAICSGFCRTRNNRKLRLTNVGTTEIQVFCTGTSIHRSIARTGDKNKQDRICGLVISLEFHNTVVSVRMLLDFRPVRLSPETHRHCRPGPKPASYWPDSGIHLDALASVFERIENP